MSGDPGLSVTVVIPVRNAPDLLARCLETLRKQTVPAEECEVLVVDDGSSDRTPEVAERLGARVVRQTRLGASAARNRGVREARGRFVLFLDADCEADERWIEEIRRPLVESDGIDGAVGRYESVQTSLVARFVQLELEARYARMHAHDRIDFLNSGNCALRRDLLLNYPFDETFQRLEDVELSFRIARDGRALVYAPSARVNHLHPETLSALLRRKFNYARYAFPLYRRYPDKAAADSSTPPARRARLVLLALAPVFLLGMLIHPAWGLAALLSAGISVALSSGVIARAFRNSLQLGLASLSFLLLGSLAFVAGGARGLLAGRAPEAN